MRREEAKGTWSDQQLLFMNQLHLFTVMTLTGKIQLVERDGDKQVVVQEGKSAKTETCTGTERKKVQDQVMAYVNSQPQPAAPAGNEDARRTLEILLEELPLKQAVALGYSASYWVTKSSLAIAASLGLPA